VTILGVYVNPTTSSGSQVITCDSTTGRPYFQPIEIAAPDTAKAWQVSKLGVCLETNNATDGVRLALYEDSGSQTLTSTCALLAEGEITGSSPSTNAFLDVSVTPVILDPTETVFWLGVKGVDTAGGDTVNRFLSLQGDALTGYYYRSSCSSFAPSGTAWPDPWGNSSPSQVFSSYSLHLWMEATQVDLPAIASAQTFPLYLADADLTTLPQNRSYQVFPQFAADGAGTSILAFVTAQYGTSTTYSAVLSASGLSDYTIPIATLNLRLRQSPGYCLLQMSIPEINQHEDEITARINGTVTVYQTTAGGSSAIVTADTESLGVYTGPARRSGVLRAKRQITFSDQNLLTGISPTNYSARNGVVRYRCKPYPVYPSDVLKINQQLVTVSEVQFDFGEARSTMEIIVNG